jgi:antitoxin HicB
MTSDRSDTIQELMRLPYRMEVLFDEDYWAAEFPDLPGLVAGHETWEGLLAAIDDAKRAYFEAAFERELPIPPPKARQEEFSGRLMVRLPKTVHREAVSAARREGASLNAFITVAVARELGRIEEHDHMAMPNSVMPPETSRIVNFAEYVREAGRA